MAYPYGEPGRPVNGFNGQNHVNGSSYQPPQPDNTAAAPVLQHSSGISMEWTADEQAILEENLTRYAFETNIVRYAKIAVLLQNKTVRDVALRCRWMNKKEYSKRRKEDQSVIRKNKDRKEKVADHSTQSSLLAVKPA